MIKEIYPKFYVIDFSKGEGVADKNADLYFDLEIPFIMGATGVSNNYYHIRKRSNKTKTPCVAHPNMDPQIVAWMSALTYMARTYPRVFEKTRISLTESHQADKEDTSGTMKQMLSSLGKMINRELTEEDILKIRDPMQQAILLQVPSGWKGWHAYHFFKTFRDHNGVQDSEEFILKRHGGEGYLRGTMMALDFLVKGKNTRYFNTMRNVIKEF
jgi:dihydrodipicolinate reductase